MYYFDLASESPNRVPVLATKKAASQGMTQYGGAGSGAVAINQKLFSRLNSRLSKIISRVLKLLPSLKPPGQRFKLKGGASISSCFQPIYSIIPSLVFILFDSLSYSADMPPLLCVCLMFPLFW